jgi:hypothetical protein
MVNRIEEIDRTGCRQVFEDRFTATRMASDYISVYRQLVLDMHRSQFAHGTNDDQKGIGC